MSEGKFAILCNSIIDCCGFLCITYAAMFFEKPGILFWYLLLLLTGTNVKMRTEGENNA